MTPEALKAIGARTPYEKAIAGWNDLTLQQRACIESIAAIEWWRGYHARANTERAMIRGPLSVPVSPRDDSIVMAENRGLRDEIVKAQSITAAWLSVFETIEAHLKDRIAMRDEADPARYLRIIRDSVEDVARDGKAIANARWADYSRHQDEVKRLHSLINRILYADERGQGLGYQEALDAAAEAINYNGTGNRSNYIEDNSPPEKAPCPIFRLA